MKKSLPLLLTLLALSAGCKQGPSLTVCLLNPQDQSLECADPEGQTFTLRLIQADNYVCMAPQDFKTLLDWMKQRCYK